MEIGRELAAWLDDPRRTAASRERTQAAARRMHASPPLAEFRTAIDGAETSASVAAAIDRLFAAPSWVEDLLADWTGDTAADPWFMPPFRAVSGKFHQSALIVDEPKAAVALAVLDAERLAAYKRAGGGMGSVNFAGRRIVLRFLRAEGATLEMWRAPQLDEEFRASKGGRARRIATRRLVEGETLWLDTAERSYVIESAAGPTVFLQGEVRIGGALVSREYDARTGELVAATSGSEADTRAELMLVFLRRASRTEAAPLFEQYAREAPFHLRWQAMREWLALDAQSALPMLREMAASDPHPEVRAAAKSALAMIDERMPCPA